VPDLRQWVRMRGPEFRATYGDTALARPGRRGLARNALAYGVDDETRARAREDASALVRDQASLR
jgi:epoxyqueuosine reductase QueG